MENAYYKDSTSMPIATPVPSAPAQPIVVNEQFRYINSNIIQQNEVRKMPTRFLLHKFSLFMNVAAIGSALNLSVGQVWGMTVQHIFLLEKMVRSYTVLLCFVIVLNELEWVSIIKESPILNQFACRGLFYTFVGILGKVMNDVGNDNYFTYRMKQWNKNRSNGSITFQIPTEEQFAELYILFASCSLFLIGLVYIIMGFLKLQSKIERHIEEYHDRVTLWKAEHAAQKAGIRFGRHA